MPPGSHAQRRLRAGAELYDLAYVDDFLVTGPDAAHGKQLLTKLFPCKDLGTVSRYRGMEIAINEQVLTISL